MRHRWWQPGGMSKQMLVTILIFIAIHLNSIID